MSSQYKKLSNDVLAPWKSAGFYYGDPRLNALSFAILAPNAHNMQPWSVALGENNDILIFPDLDKLLPASDPFGRQTIISFGCFIELLVMAAAEQGYKIKLIPFPEGENSHTLDGLPIAQAIFIKAADVKVDPLFKYIVKRRSAKHAFKAKFTLDSKKIEAICTQIAPTVHCYACLEESKLDDIRQLLEEAWLLDFQKLSIVEENGTVYRIGKTQTRLQPDGLCLTGHFIEILRILGIISRQKLMQPKSFIFNVAKKTGQDAARSAKGIIWITTETNDRCDQIEAGRAWVRINLMTTKLGIGLHPMSQILQEYPEMSNLRQKIYEKLSKNGETIQMIGCVGMGGQQKLSPRWLFPAKLQADTLK